MSQHPAPQGRPPRRALAAATAIGAVGVSSLPLTLAYPSELVPYLLALAAPLSVAIVGEATGQRWLRSVGIGTLLVGAVAPSLGFGLILAALAIIGPLGVVLTLGPALRRIDPTAGTAFLSACAIVIAGAFAAAALSPPMVLGVTVLILVGGTVTTIARLGDEPDLGGPDLGGPDLGGPDLGGPDLSGPDRR